jgi:hypothetical protein
MAWVMARMWDSVNEPRSGEPRCPLGHRHVWTTPADQGLIFGSVRVLGAVMSSAFYAEDEFRWP